MSPNAKVAYDFFVSNGYTPEQSAGIVGNVAQESAFNPVATAKGDGKDGSDSVGLFQWNGSRARGLREFASANGADPGSLETQLRYALQELNTTESAANARLKSASTVDQAAEAFTHFERPRGWNATDGRASDGFGNRLQQSLAAYSEFAGRAAPITYGDLTVPQITPTVAAAQQETERALHREITAPSLWQNVGDVASTSWMIGTALGDTPLGRAAIPDPSFKWDPDSFKVATQGVPEEYWPALADAHSADHVAWLRGRIEEKMAVQDRLARLGWGGTALQVIATLLDPVALAVAVATEGAAASVLVPAKATRIGSILGRATSGALAGAATMGAIDAADLEKHNLSSYLLAAGMGMGISGTLGAMHRGLPAETAGAINRAGQRLVADGEALAQGIDEAPAEGFVRYYHGGSNAGEGPVWLTPQFDYAEGYARGLQGGKVWHVDIPRSKAAALGGFDEVNGHPINFEAPAEVQKQLRQAGDLSAARAPKPDFFMTDDALESLHNGNIPHTAFRYIRTDASAAIDKSNIPAARALGNAMLEDGVGKVDHSVTGISAELEMRRFYQAEAARIRAAAEGHYNDWAKDFTAIERHTRIGEFQDLVGRYIRNPDAFPNVDPAIEKMAAVYRKFFKDRLEFQQNPLKPEGQVGRAVGGAEGIPTNPNYLPRIYDPRKIKDLVERYTSSRVQEVIAGAIRSANPDLDQAVIDKMAKGLMHRKMNEAYGIHENPHFAFLGADKDALRQVLRDEYGLDNADINHVLSRLPQREKGGGIDAHLKHRIDLDEGYVGRIQPKFGGPHEEIHFHDLLVNDAALVADIYNRRTAGRIALARMRIADKDGNVVLNGITKDSEFEAYLDSIRRQAADMALDGKKSNVEAAEKNLQFAYTSILGRAQPSQLGKFAEFSRWVRKFNFARLMNVMGFNQVQEMSHIVGQTSMKAMMQQMPVLGRIRNMDGAMVRKHALDRDLEALGLATEELRNKRYQRWDEYGADHRLGRSQLVNNIDHVLDKTGQFTQTISGMRHADEFSKLWAARAAAQSFAELAGNPSKANLKRMASLGLSEKDVGRIVEQIKTHSTIETGPVFGGKLKALNLESWKDLDARSAFENALFRWSRRIIQENDYGTMAHWMSNPAVQMILQFRSFVAHGWTKQLLHNVHMRDMNSFTTLAYSMMAGAATYSVLENLKAVGRKDREAYLKKRLDTKQLAAAAFSRAGLSSWIPTIVDSGRVAIGARPLFDTRSSAQSSDMWLGNPTTGLLDDIAKSVKGAIRPTLDGRPRTAEDTRDMIRPLLWQNSLPVTILMNYLTRQMPDRPPRG